MPKRGTPRAPAGAVKLARAIAATVADVGVKAAAAELKVSKGTAAKIERAVRLGRPIGSVIGSKRGLDKWQGRVENVKKNAPPAVRDVITGKAAPERHKRATKPEARARQDHAGEIRSKWSDKKLGDAAGVSERKAKTIRQKLAEGKELKPAEKKIIDRAEEKLKDVGIGFIDGIRVITPSQGRAIISKMDGKERSQHVSTKPGMTWEGVQNWIKEIHGPIKSNVKVFNSGTGSNPVWVFVISYEDADDGPPDDDWDDDWREDALGEGFWDEAGEPEDE